MIPELVDSFNMSIAALGSLSASYFFAYASAQIPVGLLLDRYSTNIILSLSCLAIGISSFAFAFTDSISIANLCRVVIGLGSAFAFVGCLKLAANWFPANKFAFIIGLTNFFGVAGAIIGGNPIAHAVDSLGWRYVMVFSGVIGLFIAMLLWSVIQDGENLTTKKVDFKFIPKLVSVLKVKQIWIVAAFGGFMVAPITTYSELWGVPFLVDTYGLTRPVAAQITTLTFIGIGVGGPIVGFISDQMRQRKLPLLVGSIGALCTISTILLCPNLPINLMYVLHVIFGIFSSSMLLCFSLNSETTKASVRATTIALTNSIIMIMGASLQIISGNLLDYSDTNYQISFTPVIICYLLALYCFNYIQETKCTFNDRE